MLGIGSIGASPIGGLPDDAKAIAARAAALAREIGIEIISHEGAEMIFEASIHIPAERLAVFEMASFRPMKVSTRYVVKT